MKLPYKPIFKKIAGGRVLSTGRIVMECPSCALCQFLALVLKATYSIKMVGSLPPPYYLGNYLVNLKRIKRC